MHDLIPFYFEQQQVRVVRGEDGEPWFVAADVCRILDISKHRDAVARLDDDERGSVKVDTLGGAQEVAAVSESGLYTLILRSNKPEAKPFRKWVTSAVLPEIRRTGKYDPVPQPERLPTHLETAEALVEALRAKQKLEQQIEADAPKVEFYDRVRESEGEFTVAQVAKALGTGEKRLFALLRGRGYLQSTRARWNEPYQQWVERGWIRWIVKNGHWGGVERAYGQPIITPKGAQGLAEALADVLPKRKREEAARPKQQGLPGLLN